MIKAGLISILLQFSGDYVAQYQFDGSLGQSVLGVPVEPLKPPCDVTARFDKVLRQKNNQKISFKKSEQMKMSFEFKCVLDGQKTRSYSLSPEYIYLDDLRTESATIYISDQFKNVQLKINTLEI